MKTKLVSDKDTLRAIVAVVALGGDAASIVAARTGVPYKVADAALRRDAKKGLIHATALGHMLTAAGAKLARDYVAGIEPEVLVARGERAAGERTTWTMARWLEASTRAVNSATWQEVAA